MNIQYRKKGFPDIVTHTAWGIAIHHWLLLLWKNKFRISLRSVPKVFLITVNAILNAPVQCFEYYRFRAAINKTEIKRPVFIIGHYRSGTTFLHYLLSKDPDFSWCSTVEGMTPYTFLTLGRISRAVLESAMPAKRPQDNVEAGATMPLEEEFAMGNISRASFVHGYYFPQSIRQSFEENVLFTSSHPDIVNHWRRSFLFFVKKLVYNKGGKSIILKSPANTARIKELMNLFPDARFIHVYRNPYDVYSSTVNLYEKILPVLGLHQVENEPVNEFVLYGYEALYKKFLAEKSLIPSKQLIEFSYEYFVNAPMEALQQVYRQLELGSFENVRALFAAEAKAAQHYEKNTYTAIPEDVKEVIKARWKFAFEAFGYPH